MTREDAAEAALYAEQVACAGWREAALAAEAECEELRATVERVRALADEWGEIGDDKRRGWIARAACQTFAPRLRAAIDGPRP